MQTASYADIAQPYVRFVVVRSTIGANNQHIINSIDSNNAVIFTFNSAGVKFHSFAGVSLVGSLVDTEWHIFSAVFDGASSSLRQDGVVTISGDAGANPIDGGTTVGALNTGAANAFGGDIAEILDYSNIDSDQVDTLEGYLSDRYGITLL